MHKLREWKPDADLNASMIDYVASVKRLPENTSLKEVVDFPPKTPSNGAALEKCPRSGESNPRCIEKVSYGGARYKGPWKPVKFYGRMAVNRVRVAVRKLVPSESPSPAERIDEIGRDKTGQENFAMVSFGARSENATCKIPPVHACSRKFVKLGLLNTILKTRPKHFSVSIPLQNDGLFLRKWGFDSAGAIKLNASGFPSRIQSRF